MTKDRADIIDLVQGEENFQTIPEHNSVKDTREKGRKNMQHWPENLHETLVPLPTYLSINLILSLKLLYKLFPPKWSQLNAQQKKKNEVRREREK